MINGIVEVGVLVIIYPKTEFNCLFKPDLLAKGLVISVEYHLVLYSRLNL